MCHLIVRQETLLHVTDYLQANSVIDMFFLVYSHVYARLFLTCLAVQIPSMACLYSVLWVCGELQWCYSLLTLPAFVPSSVWVFLSFSFVLEGSSLFALWVMSFCSFECVVFFQSISFLQFLIV